MRLKKIVNTQFYTELSPIFKIFLLYVKGDLIVLIPLWIGILLTYFISLKFMIVMIGVFIVTRHLGEMVYWLLQQFGKKTYRPPDLGFKKLDNNAIYILYQTLSIVWVVFGAGVILYAALYLK